MTSLVLHDMSEYPVVVRRVLREGERRSPRGKHTYDLGFTTIRIQDIRHGMPLRIGRNLAPVIGALEAAQLIAGYAAHDLVLKRAPQFAEYAERDADGFPTHFWGAYGERVKLQAYVQIKKLIADPNTRQAVITLWDPWLDNVEGHKDYPCTIALQFFVRESALHMNTIMRSNDVWLGMPYDVFQFTQLQMSMARAMGLQYGQYRHTALSLHIYAEHVEAASLLWDEYRRSGVAHGYRDTFQPEGIGRLGDTFSTIMERGLKLLDDSAIEDPTESEVWYRDLLHPKPITAS